MSGSTSEGTWCLPDDLPAVSANPDLEFIMDGWPIVAAVAWHGYQERGRGTVMLDEDRCVGYLPGAPCDCHQVLVDHYLPVKQVVARSIAAT